MSRRFGITGGMGAGKSSLAALLAKRRLCRVVEVDALRRHALWASDDPRHAAMRGRLAAAMGIQASGRGNALDRAALAARAFCGRDAVEAYAAATAPTLREDAHAASAGDGKPAAIVWTRLVEDGYAALLDGPVAVVTCPPETAAARVAAAAALSGDPLDPALAAARIALLGDDDARFAAARASGAFPVVRVPNDPVLDPCAVFELLAWALDIPEDDDDPTSIVGAAR